MIFYKNIRNIRKLKILLTNMFTDYFGRGMLFFSVEFKLEKNNKFHYNEIFQIKEMLNKYQSLMEMAIIFKNTGNKCSMIFIKKKLGISNLLETKNVLNFFENVYINFSFIQIKVKLLSLESTVSYVIENFKKTKNSDKHFIEFFLAEDFERICIMGELLDLLQFFPLRNINILEPYKKENWKKSFFAATDLGVEDFLKNLIILDFSCNNWFIKDGAIYNKEDILIYSFDDYCNKFFERVIFLRNFLVYDLKGISFDINILKKNIIKDIIANDIDFFREKNQCH